MTKNKKLFQVIQGGSAAKPFFTYMGQFHTVDGYGRGLYEIVHHDPLCYLIRNFITVPDTVKFNVVVEDRPIKVLSIYPRLSIFMGFAVLAGVLRQRNKRAYRRAYPSWNRKRSFRMYGLTQHRVSNTRSLSEFGFVVPYNPEGVGDVKVDTTRYLAGATYVDHMSFDQLSVVARELSSYIGREFSRPESLSRYGRGTLSSLVVNDDEISWSWSNVRWQNYPMANFMKAIGPNQISVKCRRNTNDSGMSVSFSGFGGIQCGDSPAGKIKWSTHHNLNYGYKAIRDLSAEGSYRWGLAQSFPFSLGQCAPALYHTQCQALNKVLVDYSANYENFMESPELAKFFLDVLTMDPKWFSKRLSGGLASKLYFLVTFISGAMLLYSFALKPTYDAVVKAAKQLTLPIKGESEMRYQGNNLMDLPESMRITLFERATQLQGFSYEDVRKYDIRFRSEVKTTPDHQSAAQVLLDAFAGVKYGLLPTPKGLWDTLPLSFIVDWFTSIGRYIEDHWAFLRAPSLPLHIGHTLKIYISVRDGRQFDLFWRSAESVYVMTPPNDSWLESPGLPSIAIPLSISALVDPALRSLKRLF